jgi:putative molybdopterin biosynthesis protein
VDVKPGKPLALAVCGRTPVALLPGFPTSAVFTFHEFVSPVLRRLAGVREAPRGIVRARLPRRLPAERGRTEYLLVLLVQGPPGPDGVRHVAWPLGKGSGSVTAFARADGFVRVPANVEYLDRGEVVEVTLLGRDVRPADLVVIGSHCTGLDALLAPLPRRGFECTTLFVGSQAGADAAGRGECDVAPMHLLDPTTGAWNAPFLPPGVRLLRGYRRRQVLAFRPGDARFDGRSLGDAVRAALRDPACRLQNRQPGSGTRILVDRLLDGAQPPGVLSASRSHHAVAAAIAQGRADWGVCLDTVARGAGLDGIPVADEHYDFAVPADRWDRPAVAALREALEDPAVVADLVARGFARP